MGPTARLAGDDRQGRHTRRRRIGVGMHHLLFIGFVLVAIAPVAVLAFWESKTAQQSELEAAGQRHLLAARNLGSATSRYIREVKAAFATAIENVGVATPVPGLGGLLVSLD